MSQQNCYMADALILFLQMYCTVHLHCMYMYSVFVVSMVLPSWSRRILIVVYKLLI